MSWILLILFVIALCFLLPSLLQWAGDFLVCRREPEKADCIVILSGERGERVAYGVELYKKGFAPKIILSGGPGEAGYPESLLMKTQALSLGAGEGDIILETDSRSTFENAVRVVDIAKEQGFQSILLVTSPYHSRRALIHFTRRSARKGIRIIPCPVEDSWFNSKKWWLRQADTEKVAQEYLCLLWHMLRRMKNE
jgi:uncharacterized SAM-binding protein YcdF (DUF218 family)